MLESNRWFLLLSLFAAVLAAVLFAGGLGGGFVFDDGSNIVHNPGVHMQTLDAASLQQVAFGPQPGGITRVIPTLSFALDYWRADGLDPAAFKATNLVLHALTTFVLAFFLRALLSLAGWAGRKAGLAALGMALVWAIHPLQVSAVLYVVQRMQTMGTLFVLLALQGYLSGRRAQMDGRSGRTGLLLAILSWILAMGCKEDSALLPLYTLVLELTVLRFRAASPALARFLRAAYLFGALAGVALFLLLVVPHYWQSVAYPGRDFSTAERLLTQGRVLCMYLGQILVPLPRYMAFYYDWLQPSRGLLQPWTTLAAWCVVVGLIGLAWWQRERRPLFSLGILLFFACHFMASNVIGLELAFEHRNHLALIGVVLAVGVLLLEVSGRLHLRTRLRLALCVAFFAVLGASTLLRTEMWSSPMALAQSSAEFAPRSARAWNSLCVAYFEQGGGHAAGRKNPLLQKAIDTCDEGAASAPYSISSLTNLIIFKTIKGSVTAEDWARYHARLRQVALGPENRQTFQTLVSNVSHGVALDDEGILQAADIMAQRAHLKPVEFASIGYFILAKTSQPERAYDYFLRAIGNAPDNARLSAEVIADLRLLGHPEWAERLEGVFATGARQQPVEALR
jgi:tetratricopeptide (TPR) repeat protein